MEKFKLIFKKVFATFKKVTVPDLTKVSKEAKILIYTAAVPTLIFYVAAIFSWVYTWYEFHWFILLLILIAIIIIAFKPLIGAVTACYAAIEVWHLPVISAIIICFWWLILFFAFLVYRLCIVVKQDQAAKEMTAETKLAKPKKRRRAKQVNKK